MEIQADALRENLAAVRASVGPGPRLLPMVKADAYGLGVAGAVAALEPADPWGYGVADVDEGTHLRDLGVTKPVLVLSPTPPGSEEIAVEAGLTLSVSSVEALGRLVSAVERAGRQAAFHLEVDTGMGRAGFTGADIDSWLPVASAAHAAGARWEGCFTHLHSADEDDASVHVQWRRFQEVLARMPPDRDPLLVHALNSAGALRCPAYAGDLVRPGIFLYGGSAGRGLPPPRPVVAVRARVVHVRSAAEGTTLGYGGTYRSRGAERWATVALGYGDGLPRSLGNRGFALVGGRRVPIIGRISMDVSVVDISDVPGVEPGDVVTFIGSDGGERITVDDVAELADTISYEILTGFTPRLPRHWMDGNGQAPQHGR
jgi:alanine racemase